MIVPVLAAWPRRAFGCAICGQTIEQPEDAVMVEERLPYTRWQAAVIHADAQACKDALA